MTYILDRFEENVAIFISEDGPTLTLPADSFESRHEGDVFTFADGVLTYDSETTAARRSEMKSLFSRLVKRKNR